VAAVAVTGGLRIGKTSRPPITPRYLGLPITGDPSPSRADIELTTRLREVGELCGIPVLDHVVVDTTGHVSLAERNWR